MFCREKFDKYAMCQLTKHLYNKNKKEKRRVQNAAVMVGNREELEAAGASYIAKNIKELFQYFV